jgi:hypothetical protein
MPAHRSLEGDVLRLSFDGEYSLLEIVYAARRWIVSDRTVE